jgi:uncharacterized protein (DUF2252 family)
MAAVTAPGTSAPPTPEERATAGKAVRQQVPRTSHGEWEAAPGRDPIGLLESQAATRVPELVPLRYGRMAASEFAFYRGAALVCAADLSYSATTPLHVQLCGDAHLANFGGFASPERSMLFDLNDFDETQPGPFDWDVKRLAASLEVASRSRNFTQDIATAVVMASVRSYREAMRTFAGMRRIDIWYTHLDADALFKRWGSDMGNRVLERFRKGVQKAETKDHVKAKNRLTEVVDGDLRFRSDPPLLVPSEDVIGPAEHTELIELIAASIANYRSTLNGDRRHLLDQYRFAHLARKVVGVGSVGTRCWLALMVGRDIDDPLFLQVKEAEASVLERFVGGSDYPNHGERVVEGQRLMQAASDIFLGWDHTPGIDARGHDYYFRQLWDWKASADITIMEPDVLRVYGEICGWTLARAHARSGDPIAIGSYLGGSTTFDRALGEFARMYADQNELDHHALVDAIAEGRITAQSEG